MRYLEIVFKVFLILALFAFSIDVFERIYDRYKMRKIIEAQAENCEPLG